MHPDIVGANLENASRFDTEQADWPTLGPPLPKRARETIEKGGTRHRSTRERSDIACPMPNFFDEVLQILVAVSKDVAR
jgi:hypothetical protein